LQLYNQRENNVPVILQICTSMKRVTNGFSKMSGPEFTQLLSSIVYSMTDNPNFPSLQKDVLALKAEAEEYEGLFIKAMNGAKDIIVLRNASRARVTERLHVIGMLVSAIANNDLQMLASSGFRYTPVKQPTPSLVKPAPPKVTLGVNNGELVCKTKKQRGMKVINFLISDSPATDSSWQRISWYKTSYTFTKLTSGKRYYLKVSLFGVRGQEVTSEPVAFIPQ
jgi:hypothetical protein